MIELDLIQVFQKQEVMVLKILKNVLQEWEDNAKLLVLPIKERLLKLKFLKNRRRSS